MQRAGALVSSRWLARILSPQAQKLRVLDGSWLPPSVEIMAKDLYDKQHIPSAEFFDIDECSSQHSKFTQTLPSPEHFSDYVGNLGICNKTHVVVYDNIPDFGVFSAPRVWWMFRVFGHNNVSVLDGGLAQWIKEGNLVVSGSGPSEVEKKKFEAELQPDLFKSFEDVVKNVGQGKFQVMDARSEARYTGEAPEPFEGVDRGHIPKSTNIPFNALLQDPESPSPGLMKSIEELKKFFAAKGIDLSGSVTASCGAGLTACTLALGAYQVGKTNVSVFDGSWEEYANRASEDQMVIRNPIDAPAG